LPSPETDETAKRPEIRFSDEQKILETSIN
jgi:hypothetical protein